MEWTKHLTEPIWLDNGEVLRTLRDARKFIIALPEEEQHYAKWQRLANLLLIAAQSGRAQMIRIATDQLRQALSTPPFAPVGLAGDTPPKKPPAPSGQASS
jgi:hypothetical protein